MKKTLLILCGALILMSVACKKKKDPVVPPAPAVCQDQPFQIIIGGDTAIFPNAFTPNGDGKNDIIWLLTGEGDNITGQMTIYSGEDVVFTTTNFTTPGIGAGWDGYTATGDTFAQGSYRAKFTLHIGSTTIDTSQCFWLIRPTEAGCVDTTGKSLLFPDQFYGGNIYNTGETICH